MEREDIIGTYESLLDVIANIPEISQFVDKNSPEFVSLVAQYCNNAGLDSKTATEFISRNYKLDENIVIKTVSEIYADYAEDFGAKSLMCNLKVRNQFDDEDWKKTPFIPQKVYDNLPTIFQMATDKFSARKRDILLTGLLGVTSGMINIEGNYMGDTTIPNLFCFIAAPASSGKGVLKYAKSIGFILQTILRESQNIDIFISGNISTAVIYSHLANNGGKGILFESEADTIKNTFKQEWGNYDDLLRKAFHSEEISLVRKDRNVKIEHPRLSVILSGTPNQIQGIIPDTENGLFSRFIFYVFRAEPQWDKEADMAGVSFDDYFNELSGVFALIVSKSILAEQFSFTEKQKEIFHSRFEKWQNEFLAFHNEDGISIINRLANITFRIAMVLTAIRYGEQNQTETSLSNEICISGQQNNPTETPIVYCNDIDFETAFLLVEVYKHHALFVYVTLKKNRTNKNPIDIMIQRFFEMLPLTSEFSKFKAIEIGKMINIKERTVGKYLEKLVKAGHLEKTRYGIYRKTKIEGVEYEVLNPRELAE